MKKITEKTKVSLTLKQLRKLVKESRRSYDEYIEVAHNGSSAFLQADSDFEIKKDVLVKYHGKGGDVVIPDGVTSIGRFAFSHCDSLTSVTIPNSVTSIGEWAFGHCSGLVSVTIPDSVTSVGRCAFQWCSGLKSITIPDGVTYIRACTFMGCSSLTSITIPDNVISIGGSAFEGCSGLTSVAIPDSVIQIGVRAFSGCSGLTSITIGSGLTNIGYRAFSGCSKLANVKILNPTLFTKVVQDTDYSFSKTPWAEEIERRSKMKVNENTKVTLTLHQLKRLVKEGFDEDNIPCPSCKGTNIDIDSDGNATCLDCDYSWELKDYTESVDGVSEDSSTNEQPIVDFSKLPDDELKRIVREWWNNKASPDDRRCSIYYTQHDIDDYSWVWFVENFLKLPGFNSNDYDAEQSDFCAHVCCDILGKLTERFFTKNL